MAKKEIPVLTNQTTTRKKSWIWWVKTTFFTVAFLWVLVFGVGPYYVMKTYSQPIKKSIVVSMFFDLQKSISKQYEALLASAKKNLDVSKPIAKAVEKVKLAEKPVAKVSEATATVSKVSGFANKFGVKTGEVDKTVGKVADTTATVNKALDKIQNDLTAASKMEIDKMIDAEVKRAADKALGGVGTTLLTNYKIDKVRPWMPSSWPVASKIYSDLERSSASTLNIIMNTVNKYFGYAAWGLVLFCWIVLCLIPLVMFYGKMKQLTKPFVVCPRCGNAFADNRTGWLLVKLLKPWTWL